MVLEIFNIELTKCEEILVPKRVGKPTVFSSLYDWAVKPSVEVEHCERDPAHHQPSHEQNNKGPNIPDCLSNQEDVERWFLEDAEPLIELYEQ